MASSSEKQPHQRKPTINELAQALADQLKAGDDTDRWASLLSIALGSALITAAFVLQLIDGHYHRLGVGEFIAMISAGTLIAGAGVALRAYRLKRIHQTLRCMVQAAGADDAKGRSS
jgi:hypothetical protein